MSSARLQRAARKVIERYLYELAPRFEGKANWEIIWRVERRFGLVGYGEYLERNFRTHAARECLARCRARYMERPTPDNFAYLQDAMSALRHLAA